MTYSSLVLRQIASEAERIGIASPSLLAGIIEPSRLARESFWVGEREMFEVVARALGASNTSGLGLRLGAAGSFTALGASGMFMSVAQSFRDAVRALAHFELVSRDTGSILLTDEGSTVTLTFAALDGPSLFQQCMTEFIASSLATLLTRFGGNSARFTSIHFNYPAPLHVATYEMAFGCELKFNQPSFELVVDQALADRVQMLYQPTLAQHLWRLSEEELARSPRRRSIVDDVRDGLRVNWGSRPPSLAMLARRLGLSERSLRRRLAEMKVHYRSLVAEQQREVASQMLRRDGVSVKEIAHGLGYDSPSAFHRAFKRWTGASPTNHRRTDD